MLLLHSRQLNKTSEDISDIFSGVALQKKGLQFTDIFESESVRKNAK